MKQAYVELRSYETLDADTRRRVDTCDAVSNKIIQQAQEIFAAAAEETGIENKPVRWSEAGSVFISAASQRSKQSSSVRSSRSSRLSVKRQEAAAELVATEATLKVMEQMERERKKLEDLEAENKQRLAKQEAENAETQRALEQKRRELERLETVKKMNAARAQLKVYEQESNSDEEISDVLHNKSYSGRSTSKQQKRTPYEQFHTGRWNNSTSKSFSRVHQHKPCLPVPEPAVFNGNPIKYKDWKMSFQMLIERKNIPVSEKIYYLSKYVGGPARKAVESYFLLGTDTVYHAAWETLEERYGSSLESPKPSEISSRCGQRLEQRIVLN